MNHRTKSEAADTARDTRIRPEAESGQTLPKLRFRIPFLVLFLFYATACAQASPFSFSEDRERGTLTLLEKEQPVLTFNRGMQLKERVKEAYRRAGYFHPIYDLDGKPITEDFPDDHYHHRGLWLSWPWMKYRGEKMQLWHPSSLRQEFDRYLRKEPGTEQAVLELRNNWVLDDESIGSEQWQLTVHARTDDRRIIDVRITIRAAEHPVKIRGKQNKRKGYGGMTLGTGPALGGGRLVDDAGEGDRDAVQKPYRWANLSKDDRGVALLAHPGNSNSPPPWLIRNSYGGVLNPEWPGLEAYTLKPGEPVTLRYRLIVHDGSRSSDEIKNLYERWAE